ncbi:ATP-binding protein [Chryseobacterium culicis]|uniref:ATP-binding protein n=1 Tax=Chryseobacterium culicis TaxID=680127 RepID=UPI002899B92E|nr:ATP-binding protein [Chryseobacterium culicis]
MNLIPKIEQALKSINDAKFPILVTHLLQLEGYNFISAPGTVIAKEKNKKGSPDSFFEYKSGYLFVEYTTKERVGNSRSFMDKLLSDIDHCFNETVTKIPKNKVHKIILACNEIIKPEEDFLLKEKVASHNKLTEFEVYSIQKISFKLASHPYLLSTYLDIHTTIGAIYPLSDFLEKTKKGIQPSLTNPFIGREEQLNQSMALLRSVDKLLLTGGAGVGKSRLAVKILEEFGKEGYHPIVIEGSSPPIWEDLKNAFSAGEKYIVLLDDANKGMNNFNYLLNTTTEKKSYELKIVVTSRDYVKNIVEGELKNYVFNELNIPVFKDEDIEKIILASLPNLQYYYDIKKAIIALAKGNTRIALMATASVQSGAKNNYLQNPVLLYEEYFEKIATETKILTNPINLQALAIISFFGVLDRQDHKLQELLQSKFSINWNELWSSILELHQKELVDLYSDEVARISDQVLGTYVFYKCFIDRKSAAINYGKWVESFIENYFYKIRNTLVDVNNTFGFSHIKDQIEPHLTYLEQNISGVNERYQFFDLFWLYRQLECLIFVKHWINSLEQETNELGFTLQYNTNDFQQPGKYLEFLSRFWNHQNDYFESAIHLSLELVKRQPSRFTELLKFMTDCVSYRHNDPYLDYQRQLRFYKVLKKFATEDKYAKICNLILLGIGSDLLKWHVNSFENKGKAFTSYTFSLYRTDNLELLRKNILNHFAENVNFSELTTNSYLQVITNPRGIFDAQLYLNEIPFYDKIISQLNVNQYSHCKFVVELSDRIIDAKGTPPDDWEVFTHSDVVKLSNFLRPAWAFKIDRTKSLDECEVERKENFRKFVEENNWSNISKFFISASNLNKQQLDRTFWDIDYSITEIFILLARKSMADYLKALHLFFESKIEFVLTSNIVRIPLGESLCAGKDILNIIDANNVNGSDFWVSAVLSYLPQNEINQLMLERLIYVFKTAKGKIYISQMSDFLKYSDEFEKYKVEKIELVSHNIITYLTSLILDKEIINRSNFGWRIFQDYSNYFGDQKDLLTDVYWKIVEVDPGFDFEGKELEAVLRINSKAINDGIKRGKISLGYGSGFERMKLQALWRLENCFEIIEGLIFLIRDSNTYGFVREEEMNALFNVNENSVNLIEKMKFFILQMLRKHAKDNFVVIALLNVVYDKFNDWFFEFFRELLLVNKDTELLKEISFSRTESWSGSRVPIIQSKINFLEKVVATIKTLPNLLDYAAHIKHFEQFIRWKQEEIEQELKRDFIEQASY